MAAEQRAPWRLQLSVHLVLNGVADGMVDTLIPENTIVTGDVNHVEMDLTEATPVLIACSSRFAPASATPGFSDDAPHGKPWLRVRTS